MSNFERICKKANSELSNYTRNQCVKLGLRSGPQKRNNAPTNYQRVNATYANVRTRNQLNPALSFFAKKRAGNNVTAKKTTPPKVYNGQQWIPNGHGGWKKANKSKQYNGHQWIPNGHGGWKKANKNKQYNGQQWTPNGHGGWKKANKNNQYNGQQWTPNGHGGWKKVAAAASLMPRNKRQPMSCKCKANINGKKFCMCNVPDLPQIHNKWVLTKF